MDIVKGQIVRAKAGRDKGGYFVVFILDDAFAYICDGKSRKVEKLKKKKYIHLEPTKTIVEKELKTNREVKKVLREFISDEAGR